MIRNKFKGKYIGGILQADWNFDDLKLTMREYDEFEVIIRKPIDWNVDNMRKFFHGPVIDFLRSQLRNFGIVLTKDECKVWVKEQFLDRQEQNGISFLRSTAALNRDEYKTLLKDINEFCMDRFGCGLPEADKID